MVPKKLIPQRVRWFKAALKREIRHRVQVRTLFWDHFCGNNAFHYMRTSLKTTALCGVLAGLTAFTACVDNSDVEPVSPSCSDGMIQESESCDDGNSVNGDGCDANCAIESGWDCTGQPSTCTPKTHDPEGPIIIEFSASTTRLSEGESIVFTAIVTDPDGIEDLIGGTLSTAGLVLGSFATSAQEGAYSLALTWEAIHQASTIEFDTHEQRSFTAEFFDTTQKRNSATIEIELHCDGWGACDGHCRDLDNDEDHCGACRHECDGCVIGRCLTLSECYNIHENPTLSCEQICSEQSATCTEGVTCWFPYIATGGKFNWGPSATFTFYSEVACELPNPYTPVLFRDTCDTPEIPHDWIRCCCGG